MGECMSDIVEFFCNIISPPEPLPMLPKVLPGIFTRTKVEGMEEFLKAKLKANLRKDLTEKAASIESECTFEVSYDEEERLWSMNYSRNDFSRSFIFKMPAIPKVPMKVYKLEENPDLGLGKRWMTVARNKAGNVFIFSEDRTNDLSDTSQGMLSIRRNFSDEWKTMTQVTTLKGINVECVEVFERNI